MEKFIDTYVGNDPSAAEMFRELGRVINGETKVELEFAAPDKPRIGQIVVSDGVEWDPLSAGVPRLVWFNGTAWVALDA